MGRGKAAGSKERPRQPSSSEPARRDALASRRDGGVQGKAPPRSLKPTDPFPRDRRTDRDKAAGSQERPRRFPFAAGRMTRPRRFPFAGGQTARPRRFPFAAGQMTRPRRHCPVSRPPPPPFCRDAAPLARASAGQDPPGEGGGTRWKGWINRGAGDRCAAGVGSPLQSQGHPGDGLGERHRPSRAELRSLHGVALTVDTFVEVTIIVILRKLITMPVQSTLPSPQ
mgnify:CR=1 FL=1